MFLDPSKPTVINPKLTGGKKPYRFSIQKKHAAVQFDPVTGRLTIRGDKIDLHQEARNGLMASQMQGQGAASRPSDTAAASAGPAVPPAIPALRIGTSIPSRSQTGVFIVISLPQILLARSYRS